MKKILAASAAFVLLGAPAAFAQQSQDGQHWHQQGGQGGQGSQRGQGQAQAQGQQGRAPASNPAPNTGRPDWNAYLKNNPDLQQAYKNNQRSPTYIETPQAFAQRHYQEHGQSEHRALPTLPDSQRSGQQYGGGQRSGQQYGNGPQQWNGGQQGRGNDQNRWNDRFRGDNGRWRDERGQFRNYQRNFEAQRRFRFGFYERPRGWYYRRWTFGEFLPQLFWSQNYWIYDYQDFGLPYPPPGCVWVRYGDDAMLIDRYTGEIVQVIYGIFY